MPGQYLSIRYTERLDAAGAVRSVGSKGDSFDNAAAESLIGLYKTELIRRRGPWRGLLHSACGDIPPIEYEDNHYRSIADLTEDQPEHRASTEPARLQDFPESFLWCGTKIEIARQIGNAVPVGLARAIALHLKPHMTVAVQ